MSISAETVHFRGLDSLQFFAAFLVVIGHIPLYRKSVGLLHPSSAVVFFRGAPAVYFFFVLSGLLWTGVRARHLARQHFLPVLRNAVPLS
jgi:peptidoglycan/LPS O-acetylase OafA/YrhL